MVGSSQFSYPEELLVNETMTKRRNASKRTSRNNFPRVPKPDMLAYHGPIPSNTAETGIVATLRDIATYVSGAGGDFVSYLDNNPSGTDNWSEYSTSWSEYRVLGVRFNYVPQFSVNTTAIITAPLVHSVLHMKSTPAVASFSQGLSYGDAKLGHITKPFIREWRMASAEEGTYLDTGAPSATAFTFMAYSASLTAATTYGYVFRTWLVQFRNSRK